MFGLDESVVSGDYSSPAGSCERGDKCSGRLTMIQIMKEIFRIVTQT